VAARRSRRRVPAKFTSAWVMTWQAAAALQHACVGAHPRRAAAILQMNMAGPDPPLSRSPDRGFRFRWSQWPRSSFPLNQLGRACFRNDLVGASDSSRRRLPDAVRAARGLRGGAATPLVGTELGGDLSP